MRSTERRRKRKSDVCTGTCCIKQDAKRAKLTQKSENQSQSHYYATAGTDPINTYTDLRTTREVKATHWHNSRNSDTAPLIRSDLHIFCEPVAMEMKGYLRWGLIQYWQSLSTVSTAWYLWWRRYATYSKTAIHALDGGPRIRGTQSWVDTGILVFIFSQLYVKYIYTPMWRILYDIYNSISLH